MVFKIRCAGCKKCFYPEEFKIDENSHDLCPECGTRTVAFKDWKGERMTREHARFEMWRWQYDRGDNFTQMFYTLYAKGDSDNKGRLRLGFPVEVRAYEEWYNSEHPEELLEKWRDEYGGQNVSVS